MRKLHIVIVAALVWVLPVAARQGATLGDVLDVISFRNIGPFRTSAWVTEIAVPDAPLHDHLYTIYAATRTGGLWKTTNNGITWTAISDSVEVAAVGAVAIAPSNANIVWMGTGDQANARSSYSGKGVFKSTDAGKTWQMIGLPDSHHIARIVIHPTNPDIVYVAAMGHLFSRLDLLLPQFQALLAMYHRGEIRPHVDRSFPFSEAAAAHHHLHDRKARGKVLLVP